MMKSSVAHSSDDQRSYWFPRGMLKLKGKSKQKLPSLTKLLQEEKYEQICQLLKDEDVDLSRWFAKDYSMLDESCLHVLIQNRPPAGVLEAMLNRMRSCGIRAPELCQDRMGRTPLHHAVGCLCDPSIIRTLFKSKTGIISACIADSQGRLPLHVALIPFSLWNDQRKKFDKKKLDVSVEHARLIMARTVDLLLEAVPQVVTTKDNKKKIPSQYLSAVRREETIYGPEMERLIRRKLSSARQSVELDDADSGISVTFGTDSISVITDDTDSSWGMTLASNDEKLVHVDY